MPAPKTAPVYYVRSGDTLPGIARHFGVPLADVLEANSMYVSAAIGPGQQLRIPLGGKDAAGYGVLQPKPGQPAYDQPWYSLPHNAPPWMEIVVDERQWWIQGQGEERLGKYRTDTGLGGGDWCSVFVHFVMRYVGFSGTGSPLAGSWTKWGNSSDQRLGAIMILSDGVLDEPGYEGNPYFHVTFFWNDLNWGVCCIGGNQHGMVGFSEYQYNKTDAIIKHQVKAAVYRWPPR